MIQERLQKIPDLTKKSFNGLDLLKFILALIVVMIHVKPNELSSTLTTLFAPLINVAVHLFFMVSSFLFYLKMAPVYKQKINN